MPRYTYTGEENAQLPKFELLKAGDYPFEIVGFDTGFSKGKDTKGCDNVELKTKFFHHDNGVVNWEKPVAQWTETLTFPDDSVRDRDVRKFLTGRLNMFAKSTGMEV